jgi:type II secretory pathway component HofQ
VAEEIKADRVEVKDDETASDKRAGGRQASTLVVSESQAAEKHRQWEAEQYQQSCKDRERIASARGKRHHQGDG